MCGISCIISSGGGSYALKYIVPMTDLVRHRGKDDEGYVFFKPSPHSRKTLFPYSYGGNDTPDMVFQDSAIYTPDRKVTTNAHVSATIAMGHRRLSVIDVSEKGHQPMCIDDERYWITYNGEIYNYVELRSFLESSGYTFISDSDTEVVLASYKMWGRSCLDHLYGMFAFVLFDKVAGDIMAARDRFGIKPLYYRVSNGFIAFASEIKQFSALPDWHPKVNMDRACDYLVSGLVDHTCETMFADVFQVPGGHYCWINVFVEKNNVLGLVRWYDLPINKSGQPYDVANNSSILRSLFKKSVSEHLRSDVPVGSCLSGGLDSSSIVCVANGLLRDSGVKTMQNTYTSCAHDKRFDERVYADAVFDARDIMPHYIYPEFDELFSKLDEIIWHQDEPFTSTSMFAQWKVFEAASADVKVMLDGQGADEYLAGYHYTIWLYFRHLLFRLQFRSLLRESKKVEEYGMAWTLKSAIKQCIPKFGKSGLPAYHCVDTTGAQQFSPRYPRDFNLYLKEMVVRSSLPALLHWEDRNSMAHTVESRVPFLDHKLVEFVMGLSPCLKIHNGEMKYIMRKAMRGIVPEVILQRRDKMGFVTPEESWLHDYTQILRKKLIVAAQNSNNIINEQEAVRKFDDMVAGVIPFDYSIWRLICFGTWMKKFGVRR